MTRVKRGTTTQKSRRKLLARAKGFRTIRHTQVSKAREAVLKALSYSYRDRRVKKGDFRRLWIIRINAAVKALGGSYSKFIHQMTTKQVIVDRKILAQLAHSHPDTFAAVYQEVSK